MAETLVEYINNLTSNPKITTFFLSMLPVGELRAAVPWAYIFTDLPMYEIITISIIGNFLIIIPIIFLIEPMVKIASHIRWLNLFLNWLFIRTRKKGKLVEKYHFIGLMLFVGIPLPVTGAWTGCIAAYLFNIPILKSLISIFVGLILSSSIISALLLSGNWMFN